MISEQLDALEALLAKATPGQWWRNNAAALIAQAREALELREALEWFTKHGVALDSNGYGADDTWWTCIYNDGHRSEGETPLEAIKKAREAYDGAGKNQG